MKFRAVCLFFLFFSVNPAAWAQEQDVDAFIHDMLLLADNFGRPAARGAAYQASAGWFSSAATLAPWGFRFSLHGNALFVPQDQKRFRISNSDFRLLEIEGAQNVTVPTAFGAGSDVLFNGEINFVNPVTGQPGTANFNFRAFDGLNLDYVPHGFLQVAIGLPSGTELTLRGLPAVTMDDVTASTFGAGLKHNISQYFRYNDPGSFQLAAAVTYSRFSSEYNFPAIEIENIVRLDLLDVEANLWMLEAIGSKQWGNFEAFAAVGFASSRFRYEMGGGGPFLGAVNTELEALGDEEPQFKGDLGVNLHFRRFRLSAMLTGGHFFNANLGLHYRI